MKHKITTGITWGNLKTNVPVPKKEEDRWEAGTEGRTEKLDLWSPEAGEWLPTGKWKKKGKERKGMSRFQEKIEKFILPVTVTLYVSSTSVTTFKKH